MATKNAKNHAHFFPGRIFRRKFWLITLMWCDYNRFLDQKDHSLQNRFLASLWITDTSIRIHYLSSKLFFNREMIKYCLSLTRIVFLSGIRFFQKYEQTVWKICNWCKPHKIHSKSQVTLCRNRYWMKKYIKTLGIINIFLLNTL